MKVRSQNQRFIRDTTGTFYENGLAYSKNLAGEWVRRPMMDAKTSRKSNRSTNVK